MSGDVTRPLPTPYRQAMRARRRRRWPFVLLACVVAVGLLLIGADRAAAAYAGQRAAQALEQHGFPGKPDVTFEGFPFLTQLAGRDFGHVHITASQLREGPITASLVGDARNVRLSQDFHSGVVTEGSGTILVSFASVANAIQAAGVPGVTVSADGPHQVRLKVDLQVFTAIAVASISQTGPRQYRVHITSAGGLPTSVLGSLSNFTITVPKLPYGLTIQSVHVTSAGVVGQLAVHDFRFSQ